MPFTIQIQNRSFADVPIPEALTVSVRRYGAHAIGGPTTADIDVTGPAESLSDALRWLRYGITILNNENTPVWWGYIEGIEIVAGALWDRISLQSMWNRVAATYAYANAAGAWGRATTAYAEDAESLARYGSKEIVISQGEGDANSILARRDEILRKVGRPVALPLVNARGQGVRLICRGWWQTLDWKYFQRIEGRIENEGSNAETTIAFGWRLSSSTQTHFLGATTSYSRTISGARGIYTLSVASASNETPIVITTAVAHERKYGDLVTIASVGGNTAANGTFKIKSVTDTTFALVDPTTDENVAGNGAYTSGGTVSATSNPIVVTTTTPHALGAGDLVTIASVGGNTAANGTFKVAGITSTTFELNDPTTGEAVAGNGTYTSGGTMTRVIEKNNTALAYGKKITAATNATPIFITCTAHGFANGTLIKISNVEGNSAANGTFKVASATTNTFALTDQLTGANIAGNGDYAIGGIVVAAATPGPFDALKAGQVLTVSGSTSNNVAFTAIRDGSDNGNTIDVSPTPTPEAAGATVAITLRGEQVAQSFIGAANFSASRVAVKLGKQGSPTDNVTIQIRNDSAGSVGSTVLATGTISNSALNESANWLWVDLASPVALSAATRYWLVIQRSGSTSAFNHYLMQFDSSAYETVSLWNGSSWIADSSGRCVPFRAWATEDLFAQARAMLVAGNQFFVAQDADGSHGVESNQYRAGDRRVRAEIEEILASQGSNGRRLLATITQQRVAKIYAEPLATDSDPVLTRDRKILTAAGHPWPLGVLPVGRWLVRDGLPLGTDIMIQRSIFVEEAVFDVASGLMSQLRLRGSEEFFE